MLHKERDNLKKQLEGRQNQGQSQNLPKRKGMKYDNKSKNSSTYVNSENENVGDVGGSQ